MPQLIVVRDVLRGGRETHELVSGKLLTRELMRACPDGFGGPWQLYRGEATESNELAAADLVKLTVEDVDYIVVVRPAGPLVAGINWAYLFWATVVSLAIGVLTYLLTPRPKNRSSTEDAESPNNHMSGQTNTLRAGARVPDIQGMVRAWPDLLAPACEEWEKRTQRIEQFFVLGVGKYLVEEEKLGETPIGVLGGIATWLPGMTVPAIRVVRQAPEINGMSLMTDESAVIPATGVDFNGGVNTIVTNDELDVAVNDFILVQFTTANNGIYKVTAKSGSGPYTYTVDLPLTTELGVDPLFTLYEWRVSFTPVFVSGVTVTRIGGTSTGPGPFPENGAICNMITTPSALVRGFTRNMTSTGPSPRIDRWNVEKLDGTLYDFTGTSYSTITAEFGRLKTTSGGGPTPPGPIQPVPSPWFRVPMENPTQVWLDFAFPQGLLQYNAGSRATFTVILRVEFRRPLGPVEYTNDISFVESSAGEMRWTIKYNTGDITLSPGTGIEVRVTRLTAIPQDTATIQYITETVWARLAAMKLLPARIYPQVTVLQMGLVNDRAAVSMGETSMNCVATRILPSWNGTGWDAEAPTRKWADHLVNRMHAADGAKKDYADIDLAGIYALQDELDAMDGGSEEQGFIAMTLDQLTDIDSELQVIAQVVRGTVYRVGKKLYVTRDEGGKTPLALFTGRSKSPDGEQVAMSIKNDTEPDAVLVQWFDIANGWKIREYQFPPADVITPLNPLRVLPPFATWAQAWRRSQFEWNRINLRRDTISMDATDEARLLHIGDVINVADDVANVAQSAGEVIEVASDDVTLTLDVPVDLTGGGFSIMLRALDGRGVDTLAVSAGASPREVVLAAPAAFEIKGRDDSLGTIYALYPSSASSVRPWLVTSLEPAKGFTKILGKNWREEVYAGDIATIPAPALLLAEDVRDE